MKASSCGDDDGCIKDPHLCCSELLQMHKTSSHDPGKPPLQSVNERASEYEGEACLEFMPPLN